MNAGTDRPARPERLRFTRLASWLLPLPFLVAFLFPGALGVAPEHHTAVSYIAFLGPYVFATAFGFLAGVKARDAERRFWMLLSVASGLVLANEVRATYRLLVLPPPLAPTIGGALLTLGASVAFVALLVTMTRLRIRSTLTRARYAVDALLVGGLAFLLALTLVVEPLFEHVPGVTPLGIVMASMYPVIAVVAFGGTLTNLVGLKASRWTSWERLVAAGIAVFAAGLAAWPLWYVADEAGTWPHTLIETFWFTGMALVSVAAVYRLTQRDRRWGIRPLPAVELPNGTWMMSAVLAAVFVVASLFLYEAHAPGGMSAISTGGAEALVAVLGALLVGRTALTTAESHALRGAASVDPVTELPNHRSFHEALDAELALARRYAEPLSVVVLDIDRFGMVNDLLGHPGGDAVLKRVGSVLRSVAPQRSVVARLGGDEFGVVMPETASHEAEEVARRVRELLAALGAGSIRSIRVSVGIAGYPAHAESREELVRLADGAQYWAKMHGKDRIVVYDAEIVEALDADERIRLIREEHLLSTMQSLAAAVDARDPGTRFHSASVARLAVRLAEEVGMDAEHVRLVEVAAMVHDVGKIGVPDRLLAKVGPLTDEERRQVQEHPLLAKRILSGTALDVVVPWVVAHHERWDGRGYPRGLAAEGIPVEARILALCDAFDAMVSDRPYRSALSVEAAVQEIDLNMGTQFDPELAERFIRLANRDREAGRIGGLSA